MKKKLCRLRRWAEEVLGRWDARIGLAWRVAAHAALAVGVVALGVWLPGARPALPRCAPEEPEVGAPPPLEPELVLGKTIPPTPKSEWLKPDAQGRCPGGSKLINGACFGKAESLPDGSCPGWAHWTHPEHPGCWIPLIAMPGPPVSMGEAR